MQLNRIRAGFHYELKCIVSPGVSVRLTQPDVSSAFREAVTTAMYHCQTLEELYLQWSVFGGGPVLLAMLLLQPSKSGFKLWRISGLVSPYLHPA